MDQPGFAVSRLGQGTDRPGEERQSETAPRAVGGGVRRRVQGPGRAAAALTHHLLAGVYFNIGKKAQATPQLEKLLLRSDAQPADRELAHHMLDTFVREPLVKLSEKAWEEHDTLFEEGSGFVSAPLHPGGSGAQASQRGGQGGPQEKGIDRLKRVVALEPRNWSAYWMMGKAYEALGDEPAAYEAFKRSGAIHPYSRTWRGKSASRS